MPDYYSKFSTFSSDDWATFISAIVEDIPATEKAQHESRDVSLHENDAILADLINFYIDHTQLKTDATPSQIDQLCEEAKEYSFKVSFRTEHLYIR